MLHRRTDSVARQSGRAIDIFDEASSVADAKLTFGIVDGQHGRLGVSSGVSKRLFTEDVLSGRGSRYDLAGMRRGRRCQHDRINCRVVEHSFVIGGHA